MERNLFCKGESYALNADLIVKIINVAKYFFFQIEKGKNARWWMTDLLYKAPCESSGIFCPKEKADFPALSLVR